MGGEPESGLPRAVGLRSREGNQQLGPGGLGKPSLQAHAISPRPWSAEGAAGMNRPRWRAHTGQVSVIRNHHLGQIIASRPQSADEPMQQGSFARGGFRMDGLRVPGSRCRRAWFESRETAINDNPPTNLPGRAQHGPGHRWQPGR